MFTQAQPRSHRTSCRGVTLIELMIGLAMGLVVTLVTVQVLSFSEGQKRITTGGSDAQTNAMLALHALQREIQMAGYGLTTEKHALGCPVKARQGNAGSDFTWTLAPVVITNGADGAPDGVTVLSSNRAYSVPLVVTVDHAKTSDRFVVRSALGVATGDMLIALPEAYDAATNWCTALSMSSLGGSNQVVHASGASAPWSQEPASSIMPNAGYPAGTLLLNAGQLVNRSFDVTAAQMLRQRTLSSANGTPQDQDLFQQIVNLQAFYGKDTDADGVVDAYDNVTPTTNAGWRQVLAVRLALVARSAAYSKEEVTNAQPSWDVGTSVSVTGAATCASSKCITLKVDHLADWKHYRYTVLDVIAPLRNMMWGA